jgi:TolA-binding protein
VQTSLPILFQWLAAAFVTATLLWVLYRLLQQSDDPANLALRWAASACIIAGTLFFMVKVVGFGGSGSMVGGFVKATFLAVSAAVCGILLGILWAPSFGTWLVGPITGLFDGGTQEIEPEPCYSAALRHRNRGEYAEALAEVERQREAFPGDLTGALLMAEIQADHLHNPQTAIQILESWIRDWGHQSDRVPAAFHRIADLHLVHRQDPVSAQAALVQITNRFPDTEAAHLAAQRIAHLASADMLAEKIEPHRIRVVPCTQRLGLQTSPTPTPPAAIDPADAISECLSQLARFPEDDETRERLARHYAEYDQNMNRAAAELERLLAQPGASPRQIARWLNLMTDLHLQTAADEIAARTALQRLIDRFPKSAVAESARHRLAYLKLELRKNQAPPPVRFGSRDSPGA